MEEMTHKKIKLYHILIPVLIGLGVVTWLIFDDISMVKWNRAMFADFCAPAMFAGIIAVVVREFAYMWRYRLLSSGDLSWMQCFKVTMLCEFSSTITPSAVGGSSLAMVFMSREGIKAARGTTITLITIFFDELFFVVSCPLVLLLFDSSELFGTVSKEFHSGMRITFWIVYLAILLWTLVLFVGIFIKPEYIKTILMKIFRISFLQKYAGPVSDFCDNMIAASMSAKKTPMVVWGKTFLATALSWTSRYLLVNAIFVAFGLLASPMLVFARQGIVWLILIVTPTPGGSGVSEWLFTQYYADMVPSASFGLLLAMAWRLSSYYIYLIVGMCVIPSWLRDKKQCAGER